MILFHFDDCGYVIFTIKILNNHGYVIFTIKILNNHGYVINYSKKTKIQ